MVTPTSGVAVAGCASGPVTPIRGHSGAKARRAGNWNAAAGVAARHRAHNRVRNPAIVITVATTGLIVTTDLIGAMATADRSALT